VTREEAAVKSDADADLTCATPHGANDAALDRVRSSLLNGWTVQAVSEVFKLLGDPTRVRLVDALTHGERCVCDLAALVGMTESAVSHQLRLLRSARLVRVRRAGRLAYYSLDDHHVVGLLHDTRKHVEETPGEESASASAAARAAASAPKARYGENRQSLGEGGSGGGAPRASKEDEAT
jgi:DNA-binding transcriptional ArsR family regulator